MKPFFIIFIFVVSLLSARAAELGCLCFEDTATHSEVSDSVKIVDHHEDSKSDQDDHTDHCQHTCSQCHFAALVPLSLSIISPDSFVSSKLDFMSGSPQEMEFSLYRPPIV